MQRTSKFTWTAIVTIFLMTIAALVQLTYIALEKEKNESIAKAEKEFETLKNTVLLRIDSKLSVFINTESTRPYKDYFSSQNKNTLAYDTKFSKRYFQLSQEGKLEEPSLYKNKGFKKNKKYLSDLCTFYADSIGLSQTNTTLPETEAQSQIQNDNKLAQQALSLQEISNGSNYWSSQLAKNKPLKTPGKNKKKASVKEDEEEPKANSKWANLNTRAEIATNAYSRKGQRGYVQVEKKKNNEQVAQSTQQSFQTETQQKSQTSDLNNDLIEVYEYYNEEVLEGVLKPTWFQNDLFLIRAVHVGSKRLYQVIQIDLDKLEQWIKETTADLLPIISIERKTPEQIDYNEEEHEPLEQLALLPIFINTHYNPGETSFQFQWTPTTLSIVTVWGCVFLLTIIICILIKSILNLSVRRGDFASAVTHELRTPLTTFKMYSELLDEGMVSSEEKKKDYYRILRSESNRLQGLVENVLTFASIEKGNRGFSKSEFKLGELIDKITLRAKERALKSNLNLVIHCEDAFKDSIITTDENVVEQIIFNLIENACKYATHENAEATMNISKQGNSTSFIISDNGPGVLSAHRKKLFSPFFKSDRDAANTSNGVGLGLALSRQIARQLGGDLKLNKSKVGASFTLILNN